MANENEMRIIYTIEEMKEFCEIKEDVLEVLELIEGVFGVDAIQEVACLADEENLSLIGLAAEENILLGKFDLEYLGVMAARIAIDKFSRHMGFDEEAA
jgi:hypothetical protein